ncbi:MAG: response regulator [Betaproteobacteria bacterium]|nr:response regulator [Betaproteobacteria bacterium]
MDDRARILVIDDEEIVRLSYLRSLKGPHCKVSSALNGEEGLGAMERDPFDVVLLDLRMPGMDGITVLRKIKEKWPECEVVVITGYPSIESAKEAVRLGAHNYLVKPVGPDDVVNAANGAMTQKKWGLHRERAGAEVRAIA